MAVFIALLRGVNVGGHQKLPNAMLKDACERAGLENVRVHLQSGNVVFRARERSADRVAAKVQDAVRTAAGFSVDVLVRSAAQLQRVIESNPFGRDDLEGNRLHVVFLGQRISAPAFAALEKERTGEERIVSGGRELYAHFPEGMGRSKLAGSFTEKKLGVTCTARNWNTVTALRRITEEIENS